MLLLFIAAAISAADERDPTIKFAKWQVLRAPLDTVEFWDFPVTLGSDDFLVRRTVSYRPELGLKGATVLWTSTKVCPQAKKVLEEASELELPKIHVPGASEDEGTTVRADGEMYEFIAPARYPFEEGEVHVRVGTDTPIAMWVDESFRKLDTCWSKDRPAGMPKP